MTQLAFTEAKAAADGTPLSWRIVVPQEYAHVHNFEAHAQGECVADGAQVSEDDLQRLSAQLKALTLDQLRDHLRVSRG